MPSQRRMFAASWALERWWPRPTWLRRTPKRSPSGASPARAATPHFAMLLMCALGVSAVLNAVQAWRIEAASSRIATEIAKNQLVEGALVPSFQSLDPRRGVVTVVDDRPPRPIVLYWMNDACVWCKRNEHNFRFLARALQNTHDVVAISSTSDGLEDLLARANPPYRLVPPPPPDIQRAYRWGSTPMTIVIDRKRRVTRIWYGAYSGRQQSEVEDFFGVTLPGLGT